MTARFITFEGGEGGGKSTQVALLTEAFAKSGLGVMKTREPGGSQGQSAIEALLPLLTADMIGALQLFGLSHGSGRSVAEVLADFPYLQRDDVLQALRYAAWRADEREVELTEP